MNVARQAPPHSVAGYGAPLSLFPTSSIVMTSGHTMAESKQICFRLQYPIRYKTKEVRSNMINLITCSNNNNAGYNNMFLLMHVAYYCNTIVYYNI